jgi:hypothetical protein
MPARSPRGVNRFHQREVSRALRAVQDSGTAVDRVEIDPSTGKISVILAKPGGEAATDGKKNPWDEVLTDAPNAKRPA